MLKYFTYEVYIPSIDQAVRFREITNSHYIDILKYIQNNDNTGLLQYIQFIISQLCCESNIRFNRVDVFCIMSTIRMVCVGDVMELNIKSEDSPAITNKLSVHSIISKIANEVDIVRDRNVQIRDNITVTINLPYHLYYDIQEEFILDCITGINVNGEFSDLRHATSDQRKEIFKNLTGDALNCIISYLDDLHSKIDDIQIINSTSDDTEAVKVNIFDNSLFEVLKFLYRDNLLNVYEKQYVLGGKIGMGIDAYMSLSPAEIDLHLNTYAREKKQQEKSNRASSDIPTIGGGF